MEEKKPIKISLSTFFLMIAIIAIAVMAYFMFEIYNEKTAKEEQVISLNNQVSSLQEKFNKIEDVINANTTNESSKSNTVKAEISDNEIKQALTNYLNIFKGYGSPEGILKELGLLNYGDYTNANLTEDNYIKTNIKYSDFKKATMNYITEDMFNTVNYNKKWEIIEFKEKDGVLYYYNTGWTGTEYEVESIRVKGDYKDLAYIADIYTINLDDSKELNTIEFHIANVNGKCLISYCD